MTIIKIDPATIYPHMCNVVCQVIHNVTFRYDYSGLFPNLKRAKLVINSKDFSDR